VASDAATAAVTPSPRVSALLTRRAAPSQAGQTTDCELVDGPTIGFTLTGGHGVGGGVRGVSSHLPWAARFGVSIFDTAEEASDARFVSHSRRTRTISVDADRVGTTDFTQSQAQRDLLIANGRKAATDFLDAFELAAYENTYHAAVPAA
jgi:hypothetical protein